MASYQIGKVKFDTLTDARAWAYRNIILRKDSLMPGIYYTIQKDGLDYEDVGYTVKPTNRGLVDNVYINNYYPFRGHTVKIINKQGKSVGKVR